MTPRMSVLDPAGRQAAEVKWLWDVFFWVAVVVWILVVAFVVIATVQSRRGKAVRERSLLAGIVAAGAATVITLVALLVVSVLSGRALAEIEHDPDTLVVRITGKQWWWQIDYEPRDPRAIATTANELHVPVGRTVELELTSGDVIHSFWVPSVHGKRDLIPGRINRMWIRVDEPGVYRGQCAEFCGLEHAKMTITIVAEPLEEFERWLAHQRSPAGPPATPAAQKGLAVFLGAPCAMCHTIAGTSAGGRLGPDLTHVASRATLGAGTMPNTQVHLAGWIRDAQEVKPGVRMPAIELTDEQAAALLAYLEELR